MTVIASSFRQIEQHYNNEESVSGESSGRSSVLIRREVLPQMFEKVSQSLK